MDVSALSTGGAEEREATLGALVDRLLGDDAAPFADGAELVGALVHHARGRSVFERSFAVECLAVVVAWDTATGALEQRVWEDALEAVVSLARQEDDLRSWVEGEGWAHAAAHLGDALGELSGSPRATPVVQELLRDALASLLSRATAPFDGEEDERLALALVEMTTRGTQSPDDVVAALLAPVARTARAEAEESAAARAVRVNTKHVLAAAARRTGEPAFLAAASSLARP